jgi:hypothetical protein
MDIIWICHVDMKDIAWISWCVTVNNLAQNRRGRRRAQGLTHLHAAPIPVTSRGQRFGPGTLRPLAAPARSALTRLSHSARPAARPGSRSWPSQMQVHKKQLINNWHLSSLHAITRNIQLIIIIVTLHRAAAGWQNFYNPLNKKKKDTSGWQCEGKATLRPTAEHVRMLCLWCFFKQLEIEWWVVCHSIQVYY